MLKWISIAILTSLLLAQMPIVIAQSEGNNCVIMLTVGGEYRLLCLGKTTFKGVYREIVIPSKVIELIYRSYGTSITGITALLLNASFASGTAVISLSSTLASGRGAVSESVKSVLRCNGRYLDIEVLNYTLTMPVSGININRSISVDITSALRSLMSSSKYFNGVSEAILSIVPKGPAITISIYAMDIKIDMPVYEALKGLSAVCRYLPNVVGGLDASIALAKGGSIATLRVKGDADKILMSLSCLIPLAIDGVYGLASLSKNGSYAFLRGIVLVSPLTRLSALIPDIVNVFVKPLIIEYEGLSKLNVLGLELQVLGNGSVAALNMSVWIPKLITNESVVRKVIHAVYSLAFEKQPLKGLSSSFPVDNAAVYASNLSITLRTQSGVATYINYLIYVLIGVICVQSVVLAIVLLKLVRRK